MVVSARRSEWWALQTQTEGGEGREPRQMGWAVDRLLPYSLVSRCCTAALLTEVGQGRAHGRVFSLNFLNLKSFLTLVKAAHAHQAQWHLGTAPG